MGRETPTFDVLASGVERGDSFWRGSTSREDGAAARLEALVLTKPMTPAIAVRRWASFLVSLALLHVSAYARLVQQFTTLVGVVRSCAT